MKKQGEIDKIKPIRIIFSLIHFLNESCILVTKIFFYCIIKTLKNKIKDNKEE